MCKKIEINTACVLKTNTHLVIRANISFTLNKYVIILRVQTFYVDGCRTRKSVFVACYYVYFSKNYKVSFFLLNQYIFIVLKIK